METIKKGSKCAAVKILQSALHLAQDGIFGSITEEAVLDFQRSNGLVADGVVGNTTWAKLLDTKGNVQISVKKPSRSRHTQKCACVRAVTASRYQKYDRIIPRKILLADNP